MSDKPVKPAAPEEAVHEAHDPSDLHAPIMREQREPRDGYEPVPIWVIAVFSAVVFFGGYYLAANNGDFRSDYLDGDPRPVAGGVAVPTGPVDPLVLGQKVYMGNCISCHQSTGGGTPGQYPPLAGSEWVKGEPARLTRILLCGLAGPVQVKGVSYNGNMPPFASKLKDHQIAAVLTYIRNEWGNGSPAVTPEMVAAARALIKTRTEPMTEAELLSVTQPDPLPAPTTATSNATSNPPK